jgi:hypothetical protein
MTKFLDEDDENYILKDGESRTCRMMLKDSITPNPDFSPVQRAIAASHDTATFDAASHRPGHRYPSGVNDSLHQPGFRYGVHDAATERAYADAERDLTNSWKSNKAGHTDAIPVADSREAAYAAYRRDLENAWRTAS